MKKFRAEIWAALTGHQIATEEEDMLDWHIEGKGRRVIGCPTGSAAANKRLAWLSALTAVVTGSCWIQVYAQSAKSGVNSWRWTEKDLTPDAQNLVPRPVAQLRDGTSHLVVSWDLSNCPEGATLLLETNPQA